MDALALYYAQKGGCPNGHNPCCGKICLECVADELNSRRGVLDSLIERWEETYEAFTSPFYVVSKEPDPVLGLRQCIDELKEVVEKKYPSFS